MPLWRRWMQACDYLEEDLASGYVRVLQEMIAAGWSDPEIAEAVRGVLRGWVTLLHQGAAEAAERLGWPAGFTPPEAATLICNLFIGTESMVLLGFPERELPSIAMLRKIGETLKTLETRHGEAHS
jgi:hypothetical protein